MGNSFHGLRPDIMAPQAAVCEELSSATRPLLPTGEEYGQVKEPEFRTTLLEAADVMCYG
ncbi:MAG: hypothetical protein HYX84_08380 [Chloroflexi bacterium]|nr:hypothetical protein [Chloroflexota bacterium]